MKTPLLHIARLAAAALMAFPAAGALAQSANASTQIGFVDFDRVFAESSTGKRSREGLDIEAARYNRELEKLTLDARTLQEDLERNSLTMSDGDKRNKERDIRSLNARFEQKKAEFSEDFEVRRREAIDAMVQRIQRVVERIAQEEKLDVIVNRAVAVSQGADITLKVIRRVDEDAPGK